MAASFPRLPLLLAFSAVLASLALAATGRMTRIGAVDLGGTIVASRDLRFTDGSDGSVIVTDASNGSPVETFVGENGFIRGTLRGLARTRRQDGIGSEVPFRLASWSDGRLTLDDTITGQRIELQAFGLTNAEVFVPLLTAHGAKP